jgi:hypothetical protein
MASQKTRIGVIIITSIVLILIVLFGLNIIPIKITGLAVSKENVEAKVKELYELANPGATIEIASIEEQSGIYKVLIKATDPLGGVNYRELYVTKDGKLLTENVILVEESIKQITRLKDFVDCLSNKGVKIYGIRNNTATLLQLNILGRYSLKLYVSCDGNLIKNCVSANVTQVPSVVIGKRVEPGVKSISWFEQATGCKF